MRIQRGLGKKETKRISDFFFLFLFFFFKKTLINLSSFVVLEAFKQQKKSNYTVQNFSPQARVAESTKYTRFEFFNK